MAHITIYCCHLTHKGRGGETQSWAHCTSHRQPEAGIEWSNQHLHPQISLSTAQMENLFHCKCQSPLVLLQLETPLLSSFPCFAQAYATGLQRKSLWNLSPVWDVLEAIEDPGPPRSRGRRSTNKAICFSKKAKGTMLNPRKLTAGHFVIGAMTKSRSEGWALYEGKEGRSKILKREKLSACGAVQGYWLVSVTDPPSPCFLSLHVLHTPTHWVVLVVPSC